MIREPVDVSVESDGRVELPLGLLAEACRNVNEGLVAFGDGDGASSSVAPQTRSTTSCVKERCDRPLPQNRERPRRPGAPLGQDPHAPKF